MSASGRRELGGAHQHQHAQHVKEVDLKKDQRDSAYPAPHAPSGAQPQSPRHSGFDHARAAIAITSAFTMSSFAEDIAAGDITAGRRSDRAPGGPRRSRQHERHGRRHRAHQRARSGDGEPEAGALQRCAALLHHQALRCAGRVERRRRLERDQGRARRPQPHEPDHGSGALQQRLLRGPRTQARFRKGQPTTRTNTDSANWLATTFPASSSEAIPTK